MAVRAEQRSYSGRAAPGVNPAYRILLSGILALTAIIAFAIAAGATIVVAYGLYYQDQVYPGVQAVGVDIGGVTAEQAEAQLDERTNAYMEREVSFVYDGQTFTADASDLGIQFDNAQTVRNGYEFGRDGSWWSDSRDWLDSLLFGHDVGVETSIDPAALETYLRSISGDITVNPREPVFQFTEEGELSLTPASDGLGIDVAATLRSLQSEVSSLGTDSVEVETVSVEPAYGEAALEPLQEQMASTLSQPLVLQKSGYAWELTPEQVESLLVVSVEQETGESVLSVNTERLRSHISSIADSAEAPGRDASVSWNGESYEVRSATDGWSIDVDRSVDAVEQAILQSQHEVELETNARNAEITTEEAEDAAEFGNDLAESRMALTWDDGETDLGGGVIAATMRFEADESQGELVPEVDVDQLTTFLSSISGDVEVEPVDANLRYYDGEVEVVDEEEYGIEMDREQSAEAIAEAVIDGERTAEIVVEEAEPEVTADMASDIEIREMLAHGETTYHGSSENRAHNVELATERANGAMVPPGGEYSFIDSIGGEINLDVGYRQGFGIVGATDGGVSTVPSVGGGVCQVSTTMFQSAFWSGMEIGERNWHLYWMPSYGQEPTGMTGLDATVDTSAGLDFTFTNPTDDWIAVVATAEGGVNRFEIWGTDPGWNIEVDGPEISDRVEASSEMQYEETDELPAGTRTQVESAHDGFDVEIQRRVLDGEGEEIDNLVLNSTYRPASNRTLIGTGD